MSRAVTLVAISLLALVSACSKGAGGGGNAANGGEPAKTVEAPATLAMEPGQWLGTMHFDKFDMGGQLPPQAKAAMQKAMGVDKTFTSCLTPEEAAKPKAGFFGSESGCERKSFSMANGRIESEAVCKHGDVSETMKMSGEYTGSSYSIHVDTQGNMHGMPMSMSMTMTGKRTGACTGKEG